MIWRQELKYVISGADRVQILHRLPRKDSDCPAAIFLHRICRGVTP